MTEAHARAFLRRASALHLALTRPDGAPVLRTLNAAVTDEWLLFHGAKAGEKAACVGRPAVAQAEEIVAFIPSYFSDPERACPATTLFLSVQVHGTLELITDPRLKAEALQLLMERHQPEGGHAPLSFDAPMYQNAIRGVMVLGVRISGVTGKAKLGQNKAPAEAAELMRRLWARGADGDARAIALMFEYHPEAARPELFRGPAGTWLWPWLGDVDADAAVALLEEQYWTRGASPGELRRAQLGASVWVGARAASGELVATARANSDGARHAYVSDVAVAPAYRGRGLGKALVKLLLDHPKLRNVAAVRLATSDAAAFYAPFGFAPEDEASLGFPVTRLLLRRS